ncbi:uncharacterized protein LOC114329835 isoform X2 [Diabrotica virgifera virgifera]|uniref:Uncharacterized protein n=1 Tax=Diabrotica virgifera virgifera TaxID=50390 RepID=A0ABM5KNL5_DIAVI|nr:uncharacterized protein LOC114329835 isoform X2 [Diabrotica virgifera virgifera]
MHFKDFTEEFYQYPHQISYSQLLRSQHESFESFSKIVESAKNLHAVSKNSKKQHGKVLKNVFTQLKNKTSTELGQFLDLNAMNGVAEPSNISAFKKPMAHKQKLQVFTSNIGNDDKLVSKKVTHSKRQKRFKKGNIKEETKDVPDDVSTVLPFSGVIDNSAKFVTCPKDNSSSNLNTNSNSHSSTLIKNESKEEGILMDIYNSITKVLSSFKCKTKGSSKNPEPPRTTNYIIQAINTTQTSSNKKTNVSSNTQRDKCEKCGSFLLPKWHGCNCWSTEEETLFCLLKLEARENFKQIKQIEHDLRVHKKALQLLNSRCSSLEKIVKKKTEKSKEMSKYSKIPENGFRNSSDATENKKKMSDTSETPHPKNTNTDASTTTYTSNGTSNTTIREQSQSSTTKEFEVSQTASNESSASKSGTSQNWEKDENNPHSRFVAVAKCNNFLNCTTDGEASRELSTVNKLEISQISTTESNDSSKSRNNNVITTGVNKNKVNIEDCFTKSVRSSKVKITISRSTVLIKASTDEVNNDRTLREGTKQLEAGQTCPKDFEGILCDCENANKCSCTPKKSSFVIKLFRKRKCDELCKCHTKTVSERKKIKKQNSR